MTRGRQALHRGLGAALGLVLLTGCGGPAGSAEPGSDAAGRGSVTAGPTSRTTAPTTTAPTSTWPISTTPTTAPTTAPGSPGATPAGPAALAVLMQLPVKGRAPKTGYDRGLFGVPWPDLDGDGCDSRQTALVSAVAVPELGAGCVLVGGRVADPYSGTTLDVVRDAIDVDHVVALGDAWQKGAQQLDPATRVALANDPLNLVPTQAALNRQKGDGDAATWLPPDRGYRCAYVARQIAVKARYGMWVTAAEHDAMQRVLTGCPGQAVPAAAIAPRVDPAFVPTPSVPPVPSSDQPPDEGPPPGGYADCAAARAAGDTPLYRGEPGYAPDLDGDSDGIACEN